MNRFGSLTPVEANSAYEVSQGFSQEHQREVTLLVPTAQTLADPARAQQFIDAARASALLDHPALGHSFVPIKLGDGRWSMAAERLPGTTLLAHLQAHGPLNPDDATELVRVLCEGLEYAHRRRVVHGELRPEWVVLDDHHPRLTGFARIFVRPDQPSPFIAPEVLAGAAPTAASDVYSLGALFFTMLTGSPPSHTASMRGAQVAPVAHLLPVVNRCLEREVSARYRSVTEVANALKRADGTMVSHPGGRVVEPAKLSDTNPMTISSGKGEDGLGQQLGPYVLSGLLGEGSMGRVFRARHTLLGREVAIKVLRPDQYKNTDLVARFFQEARTVNQINHEHIVEIIDFVQEPGPHGPSLVYCVMELLQGQSLATLAESGPVAMSRSLNIVRQLCDALAAAHKVGVVHRDVKPDNIFLIERGGQRDYVKVLDFGVAKLTSTKSDAPVISTMDGTIIGTPICMAPEQASGGKVDSRADIWATGIILYLLLTGRLPFEAGNFGALAVQIVTQAAPPLPALTPSREPISPALGALVFKCLEKDPARRPQTMGELRDALAAMLSRPAAPAMAADMAPQVSPQPGRARRLGPALGLGAVVVAAAVAVMLMRPPPAAVVGAPTVPEVKPVAVDVKPLAVVEPEPEGPGPDEAAPDPAVASHTPVKPLPVKPLGPLTTEVIGQVVARGTKEVSRCLDRHRAQLKDAQGSVVVRLTVDPLGPVSAAKVSTEGLAGTPLEECMIKEVKRFKFPRHTGQSMTFEVPFTYRPHQ